MFPGAREGRAAAQPSCQAGPKGRWGHGPDGAAEQSGARSGAVPLPSPACDSAPRQPGSAQRRHWQNSNFSGHARYQMLWKGMGQDTGAKGQWTPGAPQMEQIRLRDWDSHVHRPATKPTRRDTSPSPAPWQGCLWQQEPALPRCQSSYPRNAPAEQQLLLAAGSVSCKRAGALPYLLPRCHPYPPSKAQG